MALLANLPFRIENGQLIVDAQINGQPATLDLDTGAATLILTRKAAARLHLSRVRGAVATGFGISGRGNNLDEMMMDQFSLGGLHGKHVAVLVHSDLDPDPNAEDGILGSDLLSTYDIDLDFPEHRVILYIPVGQCSAQAAVTLGEPTYEVPMVGSGTAEGVLAGQTTAPFVDVIIGNQKTVAAIDTGRASTIAFRGVAASQGLDVDALLQGQQATIMSDGSRKLKVVKQAFAPIRIGELTISHLPIVIADTRRAGPQLYLGRDFLSRVHVWISHSSNTVVMQFPAKPSPPPP